ncbi:MAG TPA: dockerin type I domain-containing protein [Syntrophomonadaceae bacterium]|nr:dockerin type I domain-containing protein [Syntrophomonadaceae bacterium]HPR94432.1 dockerin type I domain-containing protein [Syntrophomonadaceae bacterium]
MKVRKIALAIIVSLLFLVICEPVLANTATDRKIQFAAEKKLNQEDNQTTINNEMEEEQWIHDISLFETSEESIDSVTTNKSQNSFAANNYINDITRNDIEGSSLMSLTEVSTLAQSEIYETEPNSTYETADPVRLDNYIIGSITDYYYDLDYYRLQINKAGWFYLAGGWIGEISANGWEDDLYIMLKDSQGDVVASSEYYQYEDGTAIQCIEAPIEPGTYYIVVLANDAYGDLYVNEPYFLNIWMDYVPVYPTNLVVEANDFIYPGVDGRDFTVTWTPSISQDITRQMIMILPAETILPDDFYDYFTPVAVFNDNTTCSWTGNASLTLDSNQPRARLTGGDYTVYLVVENDAGYAWAWDTISVGWPVPVTDIIAADNDLTYPGVDGKDFSVSWTPSASTNVTSQMIYIVPIFRIDGIPQVDIPDDYSLLTPVAVFNDNTTCTWTGDAALTLDSGYPRAPLQEGEYGLIVVSFNEFGWSSSLSDIFNVTSETASSLSYGDVNNDGGINSSDHQRLFEHLNGTNLLAGDALTAGDVNGDGSINSSDHQRLFEHLNGTNPLN